MSLGHGVGEQEIAYQSLDFKVISRSLPAGIYLSKKADEHIRRKRIIEPESRNPSLVEPERPRHLRPFKPIVRQVQPDPYTVHGFQCGLRLDCTPHPVVEIALCIRSLDGDALTPIRGNLGGIIIEGVRAGRESHPGDRGFPVEPVEISRPL